MHVEKVVGIWEYPLEMDDKHEDRACRQGTRSARMARCVYGSCLKAPFNRRICKKVVGPPQKNTFETFSSECTIQITNADRPVRLLNCFTARPAAAIQRQTSAHHLIVSYILQSLLEASELRRPLCSLLFCQWNFPTFDPLLFRIMCNCFLREAICVPLRRVPAGATLIPTS